MMAFAYLLFPLMTFGPSLDRVIHDVTIHNNKDVSEQVAIEKDIETWFYYNGVSVCHETGHLNPF